MSRNPTFSFGDAQPSRQQIGVVASIGMAILAGLFVLYLVAAGIYTVKEYQEAVILRWGKYAQTVGPGLHFKLPWVDQAIIVDTNESGIRLPHGATNGQAAYGDSRRRVGSSGDETLILTGDLYAAVVEWNVMWRISNPQAFVINFGDRETLEGCIRGIARSTMHRAVGDYSAEQVLTENREEIRQQAIDDMKSQLALLDAGVTITQIQMQRITPPERVKPAFDEVNASIQQRDELVYEARSERNKLIPAAEAEKDRLVREAEGYAARRKAEADGEINALLAKYESYEAAPEVTRRRMYLETMQDVLSNSGPKTILDSDLQGLLPMLDLNSSTTTP